ncbi:MAG: hypothetical protein GXY55_10230 [Phycisphaerae bacterium]|nr:hypothetical protein [Phycisphaerae bacterium]
MKARLYLKVMSMLATGSVLMGSSCLPDNFWAAKWGEIVNRTVIFAILRLVPGFDAGGPTSW